MAQVGRISGPLLTENLERNGIDLAFRDDLSTTELLYLDVTNGRIAVNKDVAASELDIAGTLRTTNLLVPNATPIANFNIENNEINVLSGDITLSAAEAIVLNNLETEQFSIKDNTISTNVSNANIEILTNGTGTVELGSGLNVYGDLTATGDITLDGTLTFGNDISEDTVDFNTDVNSDIVPVADSGAHNLGKSGQRWLDAYTNILNSSSVLVNDYIADSIKVTSKQGNIFFVSQNGDDTATGENPQSPFRTLKHALSAADASVQGPVIIYVYPGEYQEETPLVVPTNVAVIGSDMRNTIIVPDSATQSEDMFHLNGETTIENITVKDYFYDSVNDKGYGFRFAPDTVVSTRSPYLVNVTAITQGSSTPTDDPRGFAAGDAGKGALVDGASVLSSSNEASMLFHSVTFITPGVDALTMTNGVRVEWLNSFTYFANRGLYAVDGVTGHLSTDGSTVKYGAELRSIGSASIYGNYGAVADGADTLMYLIQHNFSYIGAGKYVDNDPSRVIENNQIVELNSGVIHYQSTDQLGKYKVGDNFFIDFETGETSVNINDLVAEGFTGIRVSTGNKTSRVTPTTVETGNIQFINNTLESLVGDLNINTATGEINLNDNVAIQDNLTLTGNLSFDGNLNLLGNETSDLVTFNVDIDQNFNPHETLQFSLGTTSKKWKTLNTSQAEIGDFSFYDNVIQTNVSNANLELRASGTGLIYLPGSMSITDNLNVAGTTTINNLSINGSFTTAGAFALSSQFDSLSTNIGQNLTVGASAQFEEINISGNVITTTNTNSNLEFLANGTGNVVLQESVEIPNNVELGSSTVNNDVNVVYQTEFNLADVSDITITQNYITSNTSNANLEIRANGPGNIIVTNSTTINNALTINANTDIQDLNVNGNVTHVGNRTQTGNLEVAGEISNGNIIIEDNFITSSESNSDLEIRASGTGIVNIDTNNVEIAQDLTVSGDTSLQKFSDIQEGSVSLDNTLYNPNAYDTAVGDRFGWTTAMSNNYIIVGAYQEDDADGTNSGKAYIFDKTTGNLLHTLDNPNPPSGWSDPEVRSTEDRFAWSVAISDSYAVVGAPQEDKSPSAQLSGKAYIFDVITGNLLHTLNSTNEDQFDQFGYSVAVSGNKVIVGAIGDGDFSQEGVVYVFDATTGSLLQRITNPSLTSNSFGESLASSDSYFIVGHNGGNEARIYDINTYSVLHTLANPLAAGGDTNTDFSEALDITDEYAIVGAPYQDGDPGDNQGKAYIFDVATGSLLHTLDHPEPGPNDRFSFSVAISDTYAVVGAPYLDNGADLDSGKVYVFDVSTGLLLHTIDNPNIGYNNSGDRFGFSVAISGNTFIASAPEEDVTEEGGSFVSSSGVSYTFELIDTIEPVAIPVDINVTGTITQTGDRTQTGNLEIAGEISNGNIIVEDNFITSSESNSDLEIRASGTGEILIPNNNIRFVRNLTANATNGITDLQNVSITGSATYLSNIEQTGNYDIAGELTVDNVYVEDNFISTTTGNLTLSASGTGNINVDTNNVEIAQDLTVSGDTSLQKFVTVEEDSFITLSSTLDNPNAYGTSEFDFFGYSVAISGNYAIVGAYSEYDAGGIASGKAYIYNTTTGTLLHTLDNPNAFGTSENDWFGWSVAISGNRAIVGAYQEDDAGDDNSGKAYIFDVTTGNLLHTLDNPNAYDTSDADWFGYSVAISGNYAIVSGRGEDDAGGSGSGKAYIFDVTTGNLLHTLDNPNAYNTSQGDAFGYSVAIDGDRAIVSAVFEDDAGGFVSGKAYIFDVTTGSLLQTIDNPNAYGTSQLDNFGNSVAISGDRAIVGARSEDDPGSSGSGKAYIFDVVTGNLLHTLDNPNAYGTPSSDEFGWSVAISSNYAIVGARIEDDAGGSSSGKAYIFDVVTGNLLHTLDNPNAYDTSAGDQFGWSVAISGDYAIVGAYVEGDAGGIASGKSYIFKIVNPTSTILSPVDVNVTGTLTQAGDRTQVGNLEIAGELTIGDVYVEDNFITTTTSNSDLELRSNGTSELLIPNNNLRVNDNLTVDNDTDLQSITITGSVNQTGNRTQTGNLDVAGEMSNGNITIEDNFITTTTSNSDLELRANGTGNIIIDTQDPVTIENDLTVTGTLLYSGALSINGDVVIGPSTQQGSLTVGNNLVIDGKLDVSSNAQFEETLFANNVITTTTSNANLELRANGTGSVVVQENVEVDNNLSIGLTGTATNLDIQQTVTSNIFDNSKIEITNNTITQKDTNLNFELRANGTGIISLNDSLVIDNDLTANGTNYTKDVEVTGSIIQTGNRSQTGDLSVTGNVAVSGDLITDRKITVQRFIFNDNRITTKDNDDFILKAAGTGNILFNDGLQINGNLSANVINSNTVNIDDSVSLEILEGSTDVTMFDNVITTSLSNSDLELRTNGTGSITFDDFAFNQTTLTSLSDITIATADVLTINANTGIQVPSGTSAENQNLQGGIRLNSTDGVFEGYNTSVVGLGGVYSADKLTKITINNSDDIQIFVDGYTEDSTAQVGDVNSERIRLHGLQVDDINFDDNVVSTNVSNSNLELTPNNNGIITVDDLNVVGNTITNTVADSSLKIGGTGQQWIIFDGDHAVKFPSGDTSARPTSPVLGQTRHNTDTDELETWIGDRWRTSAGEFASISEAQMEEEAFVQTLIYG